MLLRRLLFAWLIRRFTDRGRRGRPGRYRYGYGYPRRRRNVGFFGPFPSYSTRTRGGSRVTVTGCCLPIPLGLATVLALGARVLLRR
jgi:hypothetical protein